MKQFMLLIRNQLDHQETWSPEKHHDFLKACEKYIEDLKNKGNLKIAQPLVREGRMISGSNGSWNDSHFSDGKEVIVGYYHIFAQHLDEAIALAKQNPEFAFSDTARIEVRPIKVKEDSTDFIYPEQRGV